MIFASTDNGKFAVQRSRELKGVQALSAASFPCSNKRSSSVFAWLFRFVILNADQTKNLALIDELKPNRWCSRKQENGRVAFWHIISSETEIVQRKAVASVARKFFLRSQRLSSVTQISKWALCSKSGFLSKSKKRSNLNTKFYLPSMDPLSGTSLYTSGIYKLVSRIEREAIARTN